MMLAVITGYADALWRQSTWYLPILEDLQLKAGQARMEKMKKILVRMEKCLVKMEKIIVYSWQDWSCYLEAKTCGLSSGHKERALCCLFSSEM
jgi:hypothetical protein